MQVFEAAEGTAPDYSCGHQGAMFNNIPKNFDELFISQGVDLRYCKSIGHCERGGQSEGGLVFTHPPSD